MRTLKKSEILKHIDSNQYVIRVNTFSWSIRLVKLNEGRDEYTGLLLPDEVIGAVRYDTYLKLKLEKLNKGYNFNYFIIKGEK